jgi:hypothetical protein
MFDLEDQTYIAKQKYGKRERMNSGAKPSSDFWNSKRQRTTMASGHLQNESSVHKKGPKLRRKNGILGSYLVCHSKDTATKEMRNTWILLFLRGCQTCGQLSCDQFPKPSTYSAFCRAATPYVRGNDGKRTTNSHRRSP